MTKSLIKLLFDVSRRSRTWRYKEHWFEIIEDRCKLFSRETDYEFIDFNNVDRFMSTLVSVIK